MQKGKVGLFGAIERTANLESSKMYVALELLLTALSIIIYKTVQELEATDAFVIFSVILLIVSIVEYIVIKRKDGFGSSLKWIIGISFIITAVTTTSTMGVGGSILFVLPILISVQYCSLLFSIFMSVVTILGSFIPLLLTSFLSFYDLNVIKLYPGAVIKVETTLESALNPEIINVAGTKINELLAIFLPSMLFVIIVAIISCYIANTYRKTLLEQYRYFQNTRE